jgi:methyl-accepting chemotaxis protein
MLSKILNLRISTKILLQALVIIGLFSIMMVWVVLKTKDKIYEEKALATKHVVEVAHHLLEEYDARAKKGEFTLEEGQKRAALRIQNLRYEEKEYFWINDLQPKMIMHPYKPELNGKDLTDNKDPNGKRLFVEFVKVCQEKGEGMVDYMWPKQDGAKPVPKISYVKVFKPWGWIVGSGIYVDDVEKEMTHLYYVMGGVAGAIILGSVIFSIFLSRSVRRPIRAGVSLLDGISKGDLTHEVPDALKRRRDEMGDLAGAMARLTSSLRVSLQEVYNGTGTLSATSDGMLDISKRLTAGAKETSEKAHAVAAAAEEASANTNSVAASMEQASTNLASVASATEEMSATVAEIASNSEKARAISEQATAQAQTISTMMQQLGQAAQEIGKVTETITDISSQTNLLALNATIEAARAGAAGKGFAVVANEIKELARQTATATEDIKAKIAGVQTSAGGAIADIEKIAGVIKEVGSIVAGIAAAIEEQATVTKDVAGNIAQASAGVKEANERVAQTASVSKSTAKDIAQVSEEGRAMNRDSMHVENNAVLLGRLAAQLNETLSRFQIGRQMQDFGAIKKGHLQWRGRLVNMFEGRQNLSSADVTDHHQCPFGKWYYGEEGQKLKQLPMFEKIGCHHQAFHGLVGEIVQLWNGSRQDEAFDRFQKLMPHTDELFVMLDKLSVESLDTTAESGS